MPYANISFEILTFVGVAYVSVPLIPTHVIFHCGTVRSTRNRFRLHGTFTLHGTETETKTQTKWKAQFHVEMSRSVQDRDRDQDPLFPIVPIPFPVAVLVPSLCGVNESFELKSRFEKESE